MGSESSRFDETCYYRTGQVRKEQNWLESDQIDQDGIGYIRSGQDGQQRSRLKDLKNWSGWENSGQNGKSKCILYIYCRESDPVIVSPSCSLLKLRFAVLEMGLLDSSFSLMDRPDPPQGIRHTSRAGQGAPATPQATPQGDQQVLAVCTEKGVSVFALPSQRLTASSMFSEGVAGIRSSILSWGGAKMSPLILIFTSDGGIKGNKITKQKFE